MVNLSAGLLLITLQIDPCLDHVIQSLRERAQSVQVQPSDLVSTPTRLTKVWTPS